MKMTIYTTSNKNTLNRIRNKVSFYKMPTFSNRVRLGLDTPRYKSTQKIRQEVLFEFIYSEFDSFKFKMLYCPKGIVDRGQDYCFPLEAVKYGYLSIRKKSKIDKSFLLGEIEVTRIFYALLMRSYGSIYYKDINYPITKITWYDALFFCNALSDFFNRDKYYDMKDIKYSYVPNSIESATVRINKDANGFRLPNLDEWIHAAKAGTTNQWSGTNEYEEVSHFAVFGNTGYAGSKDSPNKVRSKLPNEWGFYDMSGNVLEMCENHSLKEGVLLGTLQMEFKAIGGAYYETDKPDLDEVRSLNTSDRCSWVGFRIAYPI
jgi:hypothetical protein